MPLGFMLQVSPFIICKWQTFSCDEELRGEPKNPLGRFGASIAEVGEMTGDRWTDVAIGAPMEDNNQGAVYIFQGNSKSINQVYSQVSSPASFTHV